MPTQWLSNTSEASGRLGAQLVSFASVLSQPENARRLRHTLILFMVLWGVLALSWLIWSLFPAESAPKTAPVAINPVAADARVSAATPVDINELISWNIFGKPGVDTPAITEAVAETDPSPRDGIEEGARQTGLALKLRGIVASTDDGLGHAIIESKNQQEVYAVGDKLPVGGKVELAKVMPRQVVLDNGGTYELLVLFEESKLGTPAPTSAAAPAPAKPEPEDSSDRRADRETTALAQSYRQRLFDNPQSLADVVNVSAIREGGSLRGYRLSPGKDKEQFSQLGFEPGDLVVAVNGISLDNPTNTMVLYNEMRVAKQAVFELQRGEQPLTLSVNLDSGAIE